MLLTHHRHLLICAVALEGLILRIFLVELFCPRAFEVDGIEQITDSIRVETILAENLIDHLLRMVAGPLVDHIHRLAIVEVARLRLSIVEGFGLIDKVGLQFVVLVHVDGVGNHHLRQFIESWGLSEHLTTESVDAVRTCFFKA